MWLTAVISGWIRGVLTMLAAISVLGVLALAAMWLDHPRLFLFVMHGFFPVLYFSGTLGAGWFAASLDQPNLPLAAAISGGVLAIVVALALRQPSPLIGTIYMLAGPLLGAAAALARIQIRKRLTRS